MQPDTKKFFETLGGSSSNWHFQTFDDDKERSDHELTSTRNSAHSETAQSVFGALNERGAGIFVAVNEHAAKKARTKANTVRVRALFLDFDDAERAADQLTEVKRVLEPTMVVESSPGKYHVYYVLANSDDIPVAEFSIWQSKIAKDFGGDSKVSDSSRVLRVPGYMHNKGEPFGVRICEHTGVKYVLDDLVSAFYGGRNNWLSSAAGRLRHNGVAKQELADTLAAMNGRLRTPLDEAEVEIIASSIARYDPDPHRAESYALSVLARDLHLDLSRDGILLPTFANLMKLVEADPECSRVVWFNNFTNKAEVSGDVAWERRGSATEIWDDHDDVEYRRWLIRRFGGCEWRRLDVADLLKQLESRNHYDPLCDYLNSLQWDGTPRYKMALTEFLGVEDSEYARACSINFFIGAVRRALEPGCKHDEMLVLVGEEGTGKSSFCRYLVPNPQWFTDSLGDLRHKDALQGLWGKWLVEMAELRSMQGAQSEHIKAFLTASQDSFRPSHEKHTVFFRRRCIFIGTTNNTRFLTESSANRRFLPVMTTGQMDIGRLVAVRDQLWAEAVHDYRQGIDHQMPQGLSGYIAEQRLQYTEDGDYTEDILRYIDGDELSDPVQVFIPRDFYLATVENASRERWVHENRVHKQIANAAKKVFTSPKLAGSWEYGVRRVDGVSTRCWMRR